MSKPDPQTTLEDEKRTIVMRHSKHGWRDLATVEEREALRDQKEKARRIAKETL